MTEVAERAAAASADIARMSEEIRADICVIGAGSGGLSVAAAAAAFGRSVVLIEKHKMGGDCLNFGCVPSKALLAAAHRAENMRRAAPFGIEAIEPRIDFRAVNRHVKEVIAAIAPNDSVERFTGLGVRVILAAARFTDKTTVIAGDYRIKARRFVIATGSSAAIPPIEGLDRLPYFTNETIFENDKHLGHLIVIGGGPIGLEMAQAHHRLGCRVSVLEAGRALAKDDPELTSTLLESLRGEGITILENARVQRVDGMAGAVRVHVTAEGQHGIVEGTHLLIATGRRPNLGDLNLAAAGIKVNERGILVNKGLRTTNRRVYAIGDVAGGPQFTHAANYHAGIVLRRALFWLPAKANSDLVPWVTYTDPELAQAGLTEAEARRRNLSVKVLRWPFHENDRAQAERETTGHIKVVTSRSGRILGASIVGAKAGELIQIWALAISRGLKISAMLGYVAPYPTLGEVSKRAAVRYFATAPAKPFVRRIINLLAKLG